MKILIYDDGGYLLKVVEDWSGVVPQIGDNVIDNEDYVLKVCGRCIDLEHADVVSLFVSVHPTKEEK